MCKHTKNFYSQENYSSLQKNVIFVQTAALRFDWIHQSHIRNESDFFWAASGIHLQDMAEYWILKTQTE